MIRIPLNLLLSPILATAILFTGTGKVRADEHLVVAADVVDQETLKDFVLGAKSLLDSVANEDELNGVLAEFRTERWKHGSIYIFITDYNGTSFFHGAIPAREGTNNIDQEDTNGVKIVQGLIAAAKSGGGFVEYLWDNPAIEGPDQSPKISYAAPVEILGASYYIGAGLYPPPEETDVAPSSWGELKRRI